MTSANSETTSRRAEATTKVSARASWTDCRNCLCHHAFAKTDDPALGLGHSLSVQSVAAGPTPVQVVALERSTPSDFIVGTAVSHCEVTEWHRTVTWEMRIRHVSDRQRNGGYDGCRN